MGLYVINISRKVGAGRHCAHKTRSRVIQSGYQLCKGKISGSNMCVIRVVTLPSQTTILHKRMYYCGLLFLTLDLNTECGLAHILKGPELAANLGQSTG